MIGKLLWPISIISIWGREGLVKLELLSKVHFYLKILIVIVNRIQNSTTKWNFRPAFIIKTCAWFPTHPISMSMFNYAIFILSWIYPNSIQINQNEYLIHRIPQPISKLPNSNTNPESHDFFPTNIFLVLSNKKNH